MQNEEFEFYAAIHGINLSKDSDSTAEPSKQVENPNVPLFGDPEDYSNMSEEEKQSMTEKMKGKHQIWSSDKKAR